MKQLLEWLSSSGAAVLVSSVLSLAAIFVSALAYFNSRKALRIEEARERDRLARALKAQLVGTIATEHREPTGIEAKLAQRWPSIRRKHYLVVNNRGETEAREIEVCVDGKPFREHERAYMDQLNVTHLGPGGQFRYPLKVGPSDRTPPLELELTWQDDSGEPGRYRTTLTY